MKIFCGTIIAFALSVAIALFIGMYNIAKAVNQIYE